MRGRRVANGFSFIELMVVAAIIAMMTTLVLWREQKLDRLERLASRAKDRYGAPTVLLTQPGPVTIALIHAGKISIYR